MINYDYKNYDYLHAELRSELCDEMVEIYKLLGWVELKREYDKVYVNEYHILFSRPHNIKNKDKLLLLQVGIEEKMNRRFKRSRFKNLFSVLIGLLLAFFNLAIIVSGLVTAIKGVDSVAKIGGGILVFFGFVAFYFINRLVRLKGRRENEKFAKEFSTLTEGIKLLEKEVEKIKNQDEQT